MKTATGTTLIGNGQLIDGNGGPPVRDAAVLVRDGRIVYAGPARTAPTTDERPPVIDANGLTTNRRSSASSAACSA